MALNNKWKVDYDPSNLRVDFDRQIMDTNCPLCHQRIRLLVEPDKEEWEKVAMDFREMLRVHDASHREVITNLEVMYGDENPVVVYYRNEYNELVRRFKERLRAQGL